MKVKATDADEGVNGRVWYRIVKGKSRCPFMRFAPGSGQPHAQPRAVALSILLHFAAHRSVSPTPEHSIRVNCWWMICHGGMPRCRSFWLDQGQTLM